MLLVKVVLFLVPLVVLLVYGRPTRHGGEIDSSHLIRLMSKRKNGKK